MDDIFYNLKLTTSVKNELLKEVGNIFYYSSERDKKQELSQSIGASMLALMLLCRRYGIDLEGMEKYVMTRIATGIAEGDMCEEKFNDLTTIANYIRGEKNEGYTIKGC